MKPRDRVERPPTDVDVAHAVEAAELREMSGMDIDNVYTLMDVQMRERPDARELYRRWEKQHWRAYALDFTQDRQDWVALAPGLRAQVLAALRGFFLGEAAVTDTLSPMVHAAPTDEDRQFLATQLVDEARHTIFFDRFFRDVIGEDGLEDTRRRADEAGYAANADRGYKRLFYRNLVDVTDAVRLDPGDYGKWVDSIVLYHMLIEGVLALTGQRRLLRIAKAFGILPAFRAGFTAVTRDESRHVNYGVYAIWKAAKVGLHDRIVNTSHTYMDATCDIVSAPFRKIPPIPPEFAQQFPVRAGWEFSMTQLRKRLGAGGIQPNALAALERHWWQRVEANLDEYEDLFGEQHPGRSQPTVA